MKLRSGLPVAVMACALASAAPVRADEWKPGVSITNDRVFRGISQTDGGVGIAGEILWEPLPETSVGVWAGTLDYRGIGNDVELNYFATTGRKVGRGRVGGGYIYRHRPGEADLDYGEFLVTASHPIGRGTVGGSAYFSPDHFLGGNSTYVQATAGAPIGSVAGLALRSDVAVGRTSFSRPIGDYTDVRLRVLTRVAGFGVGASLTIADLPRASPLPGADRAGTRLAFTVLRVF